MHDAMLEVSAADRWNRRLVIVRRQNEQFSDRLDLDDAWRREQFARRASERFGWPEDSQWLVEAIYAEAARADATLGDRARGMVRRVADVTTRPVDWLWPGRAAVGKLTLLAGDPGLGKSFVTLDLAARVSRGRRLPGARPSDPRPGSEGVKPSVGWDGVREVPPSAVGKGGTSSHPTATATATAGTRALPHPHPLPEGEGAADVLLVNCEDDLADTVAPRLVAAGADLSRISMLEGVVVGADGEPDREDAFSLVEHLAVLDEALAALARPRLLVIDPISAFLRGVDTHRNADVRAALAPLAALAQRRNVAVIAVTHLAKNMQGPAVHRAMGSLAFAAAARAVWMIVRDESNPTRRLLLPAKNNLGPDAMGLAYRLVQEPDEPQPRVEWEPTAIGYSADQWQNRRDEPPRPTPHLDKARAWLADRLTDGPLAATAAIAEGRVAGHGRDVLRQALAELDGESVRNATGAFEWRLPCHPSSAPGSAGEFCEASDDNADKGDAIPGAEPGAERWGVE